MRVESSQRYDVPVERGFAFITDTANWPRFWPGFVRLEPGSNWSRTGDTAVLVTRLLGRERELTMTITEFEPNRLVAYNSTQAGLPDARHERHFEPNGDGFLYRLVVEYEPRSGIAGIPDRLLLPRGIRRAFAATFAALERELARQNDEINAAAKLISTLAEQNERLVEAVEILRLRTRVLLVAGCVFALAAIGAPKARAM